MQHGFHVMKVQYHGVAYLPENRFVFGTPEMFDNGDVVSATFQEMGNPVAKTAKPVHERGYPADKPHGVARDSGEEIFSVVRQVYHARTPDQTRRKRGDGILVGAVAEHDEIDIVIARQVLQHGSGPQRSAPVQGVGSLRGQH